MSEFGAKVTTEIIGITALDSAIFEYLGIVGEQLLGSTGIQPLYGTAILPEQSRDCRDISIAVCDFLSLGWRACNSQYDSQRHTTHNFQSSDRASRR